MPTILSAPGTGKTHWVNKQGGWWQDADIRFSDIHDSGWHSKKHTETEEENHYKLIDNELNRIKDTEYIVGSLFWEHIPDAVVIIDEGIHKKYVDKRDDLDWDSVQEIVQLLKNIVFKNRVRVFDTFDSAAAYFDDI